LISIFENDYYYSILIGIWNCYIEIKKNEVKEEIKKIELHSKNLALSWIPKEINKNYIIIF
jgi:hypothetical protein